MPSWSQRSRPAKPNARPRTESSRSDSPTTPVVSCSTQICAGTRWPQAAARWIQRRRNSVVSTQQARSNLRHHCLQSRSAAQQPHRRLTLHQVCGTLRAACSSAHQGASHEMPGTLLAPRACAFQHLMTNPCVDCMQQYAVYVDQDMRWLDRNEHAMSCVRPRFCMRGSRCRLGPK